MKCDLIKSRREEEFIILGHDNNFEISFYYNYRCSEIYLVYVYKASELLMRRYHKSADLMQISKAHPELAELLLKNMDIIRKATLVDNDTLYIKVADFFEHIYPHLDITEKMID